MTPHKHILVADDNEDAAEMLGEVLRAEEPTRFTVDVVFNGQQALEAATRQPPDAVVMDIEMPVMNGLAAAMALRTRRGTSSAHLIALSGRAYYIESVRRLETGFHHALLKPIDIAELVALIDGGRAGR